MEQSHTSTPPPPPLKPHLPTFLQHDSAFSSLLALLPSLFLDHSFSTSPLPLSLSLPLFLDHSFSTTPLFLSPSLSLSLSLPLSLSLSVCLQLVLDFSISMTRRPQLNVGNVVMGELCGVIIYHAHQPTDTHTHTHV